MSRMLKSKGWLEAFIVIVLIAFSTSGLAANFDVGRIMPGGKVLIYRGDQRIGELTAEAPFPDGALLACDGDCTARMNDLLLVGADKSLFSVTTQANSRELLVKTGTVYFALSKLFHPLVFISPKGAVTAQQLILNAAADRSLLIGYFAVTGDSAEIGVIEGGSLLVSTLEGETTLKSGNKIILAQTDVTQTPAEETSAGAGAGATGSGVGAVAIVPVVAIAGAAAVAVAAGVSSSGGGGGGGGAGASPAAP